MRKLSVVTAGWLAMSIGPAWAQNSARQVLEQARQAQVRGSFQQSFDDYHAVLTAAKAAGNATTASEAALGAARTIQLWSERDKSKASLFPTAIEMYRWVLASGSPAERQLAGNDLAVLYLQQGKTQEALEVMRAVPRPAPARTPSPAGVRDVRPGQPATIRDLGFAAPNDAYIYRYNFGSVLEKNHSYVDAYREYRTALQDQPGYRPAAEAAFRVLEAAETANVTGAADLATQLMASGQTALAGAGIHRLLARWRREPDAPRLLPALVRFYAATSLAPPEFERREWRALANLEESAALRAPLGEIRVAYLDKFEVAPPPKNFPSWTGSAEFSAPLALLLDKVGNYYEQQGDAGMALPRYWAAWSMARSDTSALLDCANILRGHRAQLDPQGRLLDKVVDGIFEEKGRAYQKEDWLNILRYHVVLGKIFEAEERWGPEGDSHSALFQWTHALEAAAEYRRLQPDRKPMPGLFRHLADAYSHTGRAGDAWEQYLRAAEGFVQSDRQDDARDALAKAGALPVSLTAEQQARLRRVQELAARPAAALPR